MKRLVLIRHAHRDVEDRTRDNGLSAKGHEQVKKLFKFAKRRLDSDEDAWFVSSPKRRCIETLLPVAEHFQQQLEIDPALDEAGRLESAADFSKRLSEWISKWKFQGPELTVLCSHGDWIPNIVFQLTGAKIGLKKAAWCEIEWVGGEAYLTWLVQKHE